jgi:hypothetical protein
MAMTPAQKRAAKKYNAKPAQIKRRSSRNKARRKMIKAGKARKGDGKDVGHKNGNPLSNKRSNLRMQSKRSNRSFARTKTAGKKNPRS